MTSQFEFLRYLRVHPSARVGDLATAFAIGVGATSKGINRLEERGWVRRVRDPDDRRSSFLQLTEAGSALVHAAETTFRDALVELVGAALGPDDVVAVSSALARLRTSLEDSGTGTPVG